MTLSWPGQELDISIPGASRGTGIVGIGQRVAAGNPSGVRALANKLLNEEES